MILKKFRLCLVNYELKINTVPEDATVDFIIGERQIIGSKYITKYPNQNVSFLVKKDGYIPYSGSWNTNEDKEIDVTLEVLQKVSGEVVNSSLTATNDNVTATLNIKYTYNDGSTTTEQITKQFEKNCNIQTSWVDNETLSTGEEIEQKLIVTSSEKTTNDTVNSYTDNNWVYNYVTRKVTFTDTCASGSVNDNIISILYPNSIVFNDGFVNYSYGNTEPTLTDIEVQNTLIEESEEYKKYKHSNIIDVMYINNTQRIDVGGQINVSIISASDEYNFTVEDNMAVLTEYLGDNKNIVTPKYVREKD